LLKSPPQIRGSLVRLRRLHEQMINASAQFLRRRVERRGLTNTLDEELFLFAQLAADEAIVQVRFKSSLLVAAQFIVQIKSNLAANLLTRIHTLTTLSAYFDAVRVLGGLLNNTRSCSRARDNRDITVPAGQSKIVAICW
jgi:hypothetical protein